MKVRIVAHPPPKRLASVPLPAIVSLADGQFGVMVARHADGRVRIGLPASRSFRDVTLEEAAGLAAGGLSLGARGPGWAGVDPKSFGCRWFLTSIWRYRRPLAHVLAASLVVQLFALVTPLFFQIVIDKVLVHKGVSTLVVVVIGLAVIGLFDVTLQYLRT